MKHIFFLILTALAFSTCTNPEKAKKRALNCYVRYLAAEGQLRAEAVLKETTAAGQAQPVEMTGGIRYQGKDMQVMPVMGITYRIDKSGGFAPRHVFSWKNAKDQPLEFSLDMRPIHKFGFGSKTIRRDQAATFTWEGEALDKTESLVFLWENTTRNSTVPMEVYNSGGMNRLDFPAAKLAELQPGQWTLYLVRKKINTQTIDGMEATGISEYYSSTDTIFVQ